MLRASGLFEGPPIYLKVWPLNGSLTTPLPIEDGAVSSLFADGGVGPFDFSGASNTAAVPLSIQIGNGAVSTKTIDVATGSGSVSESAVTVAELATAITTAAFTGITASGASGRIVVTVTTPGTSQYVQVYGEAAEIAEFGQGYGLEAIHINTQQSFAISQTNVEPAELSIEDSNGKITSVISDSYPSGFTGTITDTAIDLTLSAVCTGSTINAAGDYIEAPNSESTKAYIAIEALHPVYTKGTNKEQDITGYIIKRFFTAVATQGDAAGDRNFQPAVYNIVGTEYKIPGTSTLVGYMTRKYYTKTAFEALSWYDI